MILKKEKIVKKISKAVPEIGVPFKGTEKKGPSRFYEYDATLSQAVAGYQHGPENPYVDKLMKM